MKITGNKILLALLAVILFIGVTQFTSSQARQPIPVAPQNISDETQKRPIAIYNRSLPGDPQERSLRASRNSRYNKSFTTRLDEVRPDTVERFKLSHFYLNMPALPTAQSDIVIIGEVVDGKGYLSDDKTGAYSEFTINIEKVYKGDVLTNNIITEREGADVQLPNGRLLRYSISDQGSPIIGRRYVFFLKENEGTKDFHIITGYELKNGYVVPLDKEISRFAAFQGTEEVKFLSLVYDAVINPPPAPQDIK